MVAFFSSTWNKLTNLQPFLVNQRKLKQAQASLGKTQQGNETLNQLALHVEVPVRRYHLCSYWDSSRTLIGQAAAASPSRSLLATMRLAASVGWNASQNTYLERSLHSEELELATPMQRNGGKLPPQQGSSASSKPGSVKEPRFHLPQATLCMFSNSRRCEVWNTEI